jgi:uncharacterized integral membrane protein
MRYLSWLAKIVLLLVMFAFALKNMELVTVRYFLGQEWRAPLIVVLLLFFIAGAVLGVLGSLTVAYRQWRELSALRQRLERQPERSEEPAAHPLSDTPIV